MICAPMTSTAVATRRPSLARSMAPRRGVRVVRRFQERPVESYPVTTDKFWVDWADSDQPIERLGYKVFDAYDRIDNKPSFWLKAGAVALAVYLSKGILDATEHIPLLGAPLSGGLQLIGTAYTAWFTYRYLLFATGREDLQKDFDKLKNSLAKEEYDNISSKSTGRAGIMTPSSSPAPKSGARPEVEALEDSIAQLNKELNK